MSAFPRAARPAHAVLTAFFLLGAGCGAAEKAAAKDPVRCERDPSCGKGRDVYADCTKQCADNPECMDRCRSMQIDRVGHP